MWRRLTWVIVTIVVSSAPARAGAPSSTSYPWGSIFITHEQVVSLNYVVSIPGMFNAPVAIETYVHLTSDHVVAAHGAELSLIEMRERLVDDRWIALKPKWEEYRNHPVSFAMVWRKA